MILKQAKEVLQIEAEGIMGVIERLDKNFVKMVDLIYRSKGRVILTGIGKSGIVARKIVATLNSTGTPSLFLHPVEAMHGDLGMVQIDSTLGSQSDITIDVGVEREACPLGLAPTASTTALLAVGDALAVTLVNKRKFRSKDFHKFHPGGSLGQHLSVKVQEIMLTGKKVPMVAKGETMRRAIREINRMKLGATLVVERDKILVGIVTDGDIRRYLMTQERIYDEPVEKVMTINPKTLGPDSLEFCR
jgi:arabinose-5-phosphate isomerase